MTDRSRTQSPDSVEIQAELAAVRAMTVKQLAELGVSHIAYVKPVMMDGTMAFAVHGADGTPMAVAPDRDLADAAIEQNELMQVLLH